MAFGQTLYILTACMLSIQALPITSQLLRTGSSGL